MADLTRAGASGTAGIYGMITAMWASIVLGGAAMVLFLGPLSLPGGAAVTSAAQAAGAVGLVAAWAAIFYSLARRLYPS